MADILLPTGGLPLTIFAGVPGAFLHDVQTDAKRHYQHQGGYSLRRIEILSGLRGAQYRAHIISQTLKTITKYIIQKRIDVPKKKKDNSSREKVYSPNHVSIIFLESDNDGENELLLQNFFPFAHCIKICKGETPWAEMPLGDLLALFYRAVDDMPLWGAFQGMACWALPIRNFLYPGPNSLREICFQRIQDVPAEPPIIKSIINHKKCFGGRGCPNCPNQSTEVPCDARGLCFVRGTHGKARAPEELPSEKTLLDALYRFGYPLNDSAHFDTQFPKGREIPEEMFECVLNGRVPAKNTGRRTYVNIYPDDFVRVPKK